MVQTETRPRCALSGPFLKQKACDLARTQGTDFIPSDGWLSRWKARHNIVFKKEHGEKQDAELTSASDWKQDILPDILRSFKEEDVFNADETGLFFSGYPDRGHCAKGSDLAGGKKAKETITALLSTNMCGTQKRLLFVIGKSKEPHCFPKDLTRLPVDYNNSKTTWITGSVFSTWLQKWDRSFRSKKRTVCLLVDNCSAHPSAVELTNIVVKFLPQNTTSLMQPMDMGVIKNWKGHYRSRLSTTVIAALNVNPDKQALDVVRNVFFLDALYLAKEAWDLVSLRMIKNCFSKGGFYEPLVVADSTDDIPAPANMTEEEFEDFVNMDSDLPIAGELTDAELLEAVQQRSIDAEEMDHDEGEPQVLRIAQKMQMVDYFRQFIEETGMHTAMPVFNSIEQMVYAEAAACKRQITLNSYFS